MKRLFFALLLLLPWAAGAQTPPDSATLVADAVSLHTPLNDETRGMINAPVLAHAGKGTYLVNTSRGAVIDIDALVAALDRFDGVGLDVLPNEPVVPGHPLTLHPRVILSPHAAFYSSESEQDLRRKAAQNIVTWVKTGRPDYVVVRGTKKPPSP